MLMNKENNCLKPAFESDFDELKKIKDGLVDVTVKRGRNLLHHRKFFALLRVVIANSDRWQNEQQLLKALKFELDYTEKILSIDGKRAYILPRSISFENMGQKEFEEFYDAALPLMAKEIGVDPVELENNSMEYM